MRNAEKKLAWQSKAILLIVVPWTVVSVLLQAHWWAVQVPVVAWMTLGISAIFGLVVWRLRAGTFAAAATGAVITAGLMFSTTVYPYQASWLNGGLLPLLTVFLLTFVATKIGKRKKTQLGIAESSRGRNAAQVAANLGMAALVAPFGLILGSQGIDLKPNLWAIGIVSVLCEAAADTVSSEIGQVFGGQPRMLTTLRRVEPGTDGGITLVGTLAGVVAAAIVSAVGCWVMQLNLILGALCAAAGSLGLLFDSLLGATLERRGLLNNDAVNFLSTLSAPTFAVVLLFAQFFLLRK